MNNFSLNEIISIERGFAFKSSDYSDSGYFIFRVSNADGRTKSNSVYLKPHLAFGYKDYELNEGDVLIVMVGATTGKITRISKSDLPALLNQNLWKLVPNELIIDKNFWYYKSFDVVEQHMNKSQGSARDFLKQNDFVKEELILPPLPQQKKIAAILGTVDAQIEATQKLIVKYEMLKEGLLKTFLEKFNTELKALGSLGNLYSGKDYKVNPPIKSEQYPIYGTGGIMGYTSKYLIDGYTLLLGRKGSIQTVRVVKGKIWNVDTAFAFQTQDKLLLYWIFLILEKTDLTILNEATGVPSVSSKGWLKFRIPVPINEKDLKLGVEKIKLQEKLIDKESQMLSKLQTLKKGLMQDLLGGGKKV